MRDFIVEITKAAGATALKYFGRLEPGDVFGKGSAKDLVSIADRQVEQEIISAIRTRYPDHDIYGEESGKSLTGSRWCWIIDPIDGTQSFVKHHPYFSVSVALYRDGQPYLGCVYAPALDRLYLGIAGKGAYENGKPIRVSSCTELSDAACACGFSLLRFNQVHPTIDVFCAIAPQLRDLKRCGSAALDLCFVAAGIYDGYWELGLQPYDVAAGAMIAREAGARVCNLDGVEDCLSGQIVAAPPQIAAKLLDLVRQHCQSA